MWVCICSVGVQGLFSCWTIVVPQPQIEFASAQDNIAIWYKVCIRWAPTIVINGVMGPLSMAE